MFPKLNVTVPVGAGTTGDTAMDAVSVVGAPRPMVLGLAKMPITGVALVIVNVIGVAVEEAKLASPE